MGYEEMRNAMKIIGITAMTVLVLSIASQAQEYSDIIRIGNTVLDRIRIIEERYDVIIYEVRGAKSQVNTDDVTEIIRGGTPENFENAEKARREGKWSEATRLYRECIASGRRKWVKAYSRFQLAECFAQWGSEDKSKLKSAVEEYDAFIKGYGSHRLVADALLGKAQALLDSGKTNEAKKAYGKLTSARYGVAWKLRGELGLSEIKLQMRNPAAAGEIEKIIKEAERRGIRDVSERASSLLVEACMKCGRYAQAAAIIKKQLESSSLPDGEKASLHNRLGECYSKMTGSDSMKKALFEYLKVLVLYKNVEDEYVFAVKHAIVLLEEMGGENNKKRASELKGELQRALESSER